MRDIKDIQDYIIKERESQKERDIQRERETQRVRDAQRGRDAQINPAKSIVQESTNDDNHSTNEVERDDITRQIDNVIPSTKQILDYHMQGTKQMQGTKLKKDESQIQSKQNENKNQESDASNGNGKNKDNSQVKKNEPNKADTEAAAEKEKRQDEKISEYGQVTLDNNERSHKIHLLSIIGEIEGHECLSQNTKTTKYEHVLPQLAAIEDSKEIDGLLILINTVGGDVESGLAIAEMISSLTKPTVSLVLGGGHSIGVPLAVSTDYSFIVPSGTMIIHPVRMSGTVIGAKQTYDYFKLIQDRIIGFIETHCKTNKSRLEDMMMNTGILTKDLGTILVGKHAVEEGLIDEVGGIKQAMQKLHDLIEQSK